MASRNDRSWVRRHKVLTTLIVVALLGWAGNAGADEAEPPRAGTSERASASTPSASPETQDAEPAVDGETDDKDSTPTRPRGSGKRSARADAKPKTVPKPAPTALVARVIDGDTVELASGQDVRLVGIDTPEVGECGFEKARANLAYLVEGKRVRLTRSDEDKDRYGRLLRYLNIGEVDPGLRLIKNGLAIARYDSRDGYGYHPREPVYIAADKGARNLTCPKPQPLVSTPATTCAPGYTPCIPPFPPDVNCDDVDGPIRVTGPDPHGLDADGDGVACE